MSHSSQTNLLEPRFAEGFLDDHAGRVISNSHIALVELVANSWDAGARRVKITWPEKVGGYFESEDDGTGMTKEKFESVWPELNYNRIKNQGLHVEFPDSSIQVNRSAYGKNGKGRHSMFCFSDEYYVETWRNGLSSSFTIKRSHGKLPYEIRFKSQDSKEGHGTKIWCKLSSNYLKEESVQKLLGSKFITDPDFTLYLNNHKIDLIDLEEVSKTEEYDIPGEDQNVKILVIDSKETGRISLHHGVAWWVNKRLVGEHSWKGFEGAYLDGRSSEAKRYTFIVEADLLSDEVKSDWTGFKDTERSKKIKEYVNSLILKSIQNLMQNIRRDTKKRILFQHKESIKNLNSLSKKQVGGFVDGIQMKCPTMSQRDLSNAIDIFTTMELNRTGYALLQQLALLTPGDLDSLNEILETWDINDARKVLDELQWRLDIIKEMESVVDDPKTGELQILQPLFERGLWIFGPEYEAIEFTSNKSLSTVIKNLLKGGEVDHPSLRPDFVVLPDSSIGVYSSDSYDDNGEVSGLNKVLIVELKRGGSKITKNERRQAEDYAVEVTKSGKVSQNTKIICYVLGSEVDTECQTLGENKNIEIIPRTYSTILRQAHARTFHLLTKIKEIKQISDDADAEINYVLSQKEMPDYISD